MGGWVDHHTLSDNALNALKRETGDKVPFDKFCSAVASKITVYKTIMQSKEESLSLREEKEKFENLINLSEKLLRELNHTPGTMRQVIRIGGFSVDPKKSNPQLEQLEHQLTDLQSACRHVLTHIQPELENPGRKKKSHRLLLVELIASVYTTFLDKKPSAKHEGPFDRLLSIAMEEVGDPISDRRELISMYLSEKGGEN